MKRFIEEFEQRKREVNLYFEFLGNQIDREIAFSEHDEIERILKANSFLILYNLIESSVTNAIQAIHDSIETEAVAYSSLKKEIQKIFLKQLYHRLKESNNSTFESLMMLFLGKIIANTFIDDLNKALTFSGNVDAQKIRDVAKDYGFSSNTSSTSRGGSELLIVKNQRNQLAHGNISFSECGRERTFIELNDIKNEVINYLEDILNNIEIYIDNKDYKKTYSC